MEHLLPHYADIESVHQTGARPKSRHLANYSIESHCVQIVYYYLLFTGIYWHFANGQTPQATDLIYFKN